MLTENIPWSGVLELSIGLECWSRLPLVQMSYATYENTTAVLLVIVKMLPWSILNLAGCSLQFLIYTDGCTNDT